MVGVKAVTIASGASLSDAADVGLERLAGVLMPAGWTAASVTFSVSVDGTTYADLFTTTEVAFTPSATRAQYHAFDVDITAGVRFIKARSGTAASPVNQGAQRTILFITRGLGE